MKTEDIKNIARAWQQVQEKLTGGQKKLDMDKDGDIDATDFKHMRAKKKTNEDEVVMNPKKDKKEKKDSNSEVSQDMSNEAKVDEISKDKVGRYIKKAMVSTSDAGMDTASQDKDIRKRGINTFVKRRMGTSDAVRKLTGKARVAATESADQTDWPIYKRLMEKDAHTKGATPPEEMDSKASGKEKEFRAKHKTDTVDNPEASGGDIAKATNAAPSKKARPGDNPQSDKMQKPADTTK